MLGSKHSIRPLPSVCCGKHSVAVTELGNSDMIEGGIFVICEGDIEVIVDTSNVVGVGVAMMERNMARGRRRC